MSLEVDAAGVDIEVEVEVDVETACSSASPSVSLLSFLHVFVIALLDARHFCRFHLRLLFSSGGFTSPPP